MLRREGDAMRLRCSLLLVAGLLVLVGCPQQPAQSRIPQPPPTSSPTPARKLSTPVTVSSKAAGALSLGITAQDAYFGEDVSLKLALSKPSQDDPQRIDVNIDC